jgi:hypothetical protein
MSHTTDTAGRQAYITGLRQLADYLDANPGVPVPRYGTTILLLTRLAEDGGIAEIVDIAAQLAAPVIDATQDMGSYRTCRSFGSVTYEAVSHTRASMAVYRAEVSYAGCVVPDEVSADA